MAMSGIPELDQYFKQCLSVVTLELWILNLEPISLSQLHLTQFINICAYLQKSVSEIYNPWPPILKSSYPLLGEPTSLHFILPGLWNGLKWDFLRSQIRSISGLPGYRQHRTRFTPLCSGPKTSILSSGSRSASVCSRRATIFSSISALIHIIRC